MSDDFFAVAAKDDAIAALRDRLVTLERELAEAKAQRSDNAYDLYHRLLKADAERDEANDQLASTRADLHMTLKTAAKQQDEIDAARAELAEARAKHDAAHDNWMTAERLAADFRELSGQTSLVLAERTLERDEADLAFLRAMEYDHDTD